MEISELVSVKKFSEFDDEKKDEIYKTLLDLTKAIDEVPKKSLKKTLDLSIALLRYKGDQAAYYQQQLAAKSKSSSEDESRNQRLKRENEKLKNMLEKLDDEKLDLKMKAKELTDEIFKLQKRIHDATQLAEHSDKDSSDPLSELDKQEELLRSINAKNRHIKRLLREIETLQNVNIEQSKTIVVLEHELKISKAELKQLSTDITTVDAERKTLKETVNELNINITRLEGNIVYLEEDRKQTEIELKDFIEKIEIKARNWKQSLDEKDHQLKKLRSKIKKDNNDNNSILNGHADMTEDGAQQESISAEEDQMDTNKLLNAIDERDKYIEDLERKLTEVATELADTADVMTKFSIMKESEYDPKKPRLCCKTIEESLQAANKRCQELSEMLERVEEDNTMKAKQALDALNALDAYQRGEDGLVKALRKCNSLERKLMTREKYIKTLVTELNQMHELIHENGILRKRLNIPDDMIIYAKNLASKERNKDKIIEKLTLKLRASEEMRLQLKIEKSDMRRELLRVQKHLNKPLSLADVNTIEALDALTPLAPLTTTTTTTTTTTPTPTAPLAPTAPLNRTYTATSELGEVPDSTYDNGDGDFDASLVKVVTPSNLCRMCHGQLSFSFRDKVDNELYERDISFLEQKYQDVINENENLRMGMYEILEKIREYGDSSELIEIDNDLLNRLICSLKIHTPTHSSKHATPHSSRRASRDSENFKLGVSSFIKDILPPLDIPSASATDSIESVRGDDGGNTIYDNDLAELPEIHSTMIDTFTRPTTPNSILDESIVPHIIGVEQPSNKTIYNEKTEETIRDLQQKVQELEIYRKQYDQLKIHMAASEVELQRYCIELTENVKNLTLKLKQMENSYAYMREDLDKILTESKKEEMAHLQELTEIKENLSAEMSEKQKLLNELDKMKRECYYTKDEFTALQKTNVQLAAQLGQLIDQIMCGNVTKELQIPEICADYGIIKDNLQLDYVTIEEYQQQRLTTELAEEKAKDLSRKCLQLEQLLEIAQNQIQSQQKLLNDITDNHINLRHLVADLQSTNEQKFVLAKMQRDLNNAKSELETLQLERNELRLKNDTLKIEVNSLKATNDELNQKYQTKRKNCDTKIKFLQMSLYALKEKYAKFTPLIFLTNFVFAYTKFINKSLDAKLDLTLPEHIRKEVEDFTNRYLEEYKLNKDESQQIIKLVKSETQTKLLEESLIEMQKKCENLQLEVKDLRIRYATESEHWQTIEILFKTDKSINKLQRSDEIFELHDIGTNTDVTPIPTERKIPVTISRKKSLVEYVDKNLSPIGSPHKLSRSNSSNNNIKQQRNIEAQTEAESPSKQRWKAVKTAEMFMQTSYEQPINQSMQTEIIDAATELDYLETQLQVAKQKVDDREQTLQLYKEELTAANERIETLQKHLEQKESIASTDKENNQRTAQVDVIEKTILSFHSLLAEKDKSINNYQNILESERQQSNERVNKLNAEIESYKNTVTDLNFNIKRKDIEIFELRTKLEVVAIRRNSNEKLDLATNVLGALGSEQGSDDNSLNELTDEKIEEMFQHEDDSAATAKDVDKKTQKEKQDKETAKETSSLLKQIKELKDMAVHLEKSIKVKDDEISLLKEKLTLLEEQEKTVNNSSNLEVEQLKMQLEDKDKHINDLIDTLKNFHDDQKRLIADSSSSTADEISKLAAELTRTEASNKIYHTQIEALRRQLNSLTQREKLAREQSQSLRNQLIKRPVVSIKTELNARVKTENLQKRLQTLELDLEDARALIQRQQITIDTKRAKSLAEVNMWDKQKRWQQTAEKLKTKLEETETTLSKTRSLLQTARNTINRLEKDKQILESKLKSTAPIAANTHTTNLSQNITNTTAKCCRTTSCPNVMQRHDKYTPSESPETYTGGISSSSSSSPLHCAKDYVDDGHTEIIQALKARIEMQQRKILAMELEGKGTNALTNELEKLHEKFATVEAQNIRLEAKNLQLQLDVDLYRQGDGVDRLNKRIKHLENYIIALKEESAQMEARTQLCKCSGVKLTTQPGQNAEQVILSLRRIVDKLRAENKFLKDGRRSCESRTSADATNELHRLQQLYSEALDKISALQLELKTKKAAVGVSDELQFVKEQLNKKSQLLQKAKVLLTRAAAKEKALKEQLMLWKRKCAELQNVPVIDEISE